LDALRLTSDVRSILGRNLHHRTQQLQLMQQQQQFSCFPSVSFFNLKIF